MTPNSNSDSAATFSERWGALPSASAPAPALFNPAHADPMSSLPSGYSMDGTPDHSLLDPAASLPEGYAIDTAADAAPAKSRKSFADRAKAVWDNPTPGGLVSIIKAIYNGAEAGALATKDVLNGADPTSDAVVNKAAEATMNLLPTGSAGSRVAAPAAKAGVDAALAAADRLGIAVPKYMATDGVVAPALASGARSIPFANTPIEKSAQAVRDAITTAVNRTAPPNSINAAGSDARDAIEAGVKAAQGPVGDAYKAVDAAIQSGNPNARVPLTSTGAKMQELMDARSNANLPEWGPAMKTLAQAATDPKGMNYSGIKTLRSYLGESHPNTLIAEGLNPNEVKQLYGPLTEDLKNAVKAGGGDDAVKLWENANGLAKDTIENREQLYKIIGADANTPAEAVFGKLARMASDTTSGNLDLLQRAKDTMGPKAWKGVGDAVISGLGRDPLGNVSAAKFVSDYQKLSAGAKNILFTPEQRSRLDDVLAVSNLVKTKVDRYANTSNTAHNLRAGELIAAVIGGAINPHLAAPAIGGAVAGRGVAEYLSRPASIARPPVPLRNNPVLRGLLGAGARGAVTGLLSPNSN